MVIQLSTPSIVYVCFRQWKWIAGLVVFCILVAVVYCLMATPLYESDAQLVVNFGEQPMQTPGAQGPTPASQTPTDYDEVVNSYLLILQGNALAAQVIKEVGPEKMYPKYYGDSWVNHSLEAVTKFLGTYKTPFERAVNHFVSKDLDVELARDSNVIQIALLNADPLVAQKAEALLIDHFLEQMAKIGRDPQLNFIQAQVAVYRDSVTKAQNAMQSFQQKNGISAMDEETSYLLKQRSDLEGQVNANDVQIASDKRKIEILAAQLGELKQLVDLPEQNRDPALDAARTQLVALQVRQQTLRASFSAGSPVVKDVEVQIQKLNDYIAGFSGDTNLHQTAPNPTYASTQSTWLQAQSDLEGALKAKPALDSQLQQVNARLAERAQEQSEYQDLVREYQIDDANYRTYLQGVQQARVAEDLNKEKFTTLRIFDPAAVQSSIPAQPKALLLIAAATVIGLVFGFGTAFLREGWDERLNMPWQVNQTVGLPVLGSMGLIEPGGARPG